MIPKDAGEQEVCRKRTNPAGFQPQEVPAESDSQGQKHKGGGGGAGVLSVLGGDSSAEGDVWWEGTRVTKRHP